MSGRDVSGPCDEDLEGPLGAGGARALQREAEVEVVRWGRTSADGGTPGLGSQESHF